MIRRVAVIGGGPAGIEAASAAARTGARVTLISEGPLGGRAGWDSLLPSKVWIGAADLLGTIDTTAGRGLVGHGPHEVSPALVRNRIQATANAWSAEAGSRLASLGVEVLQGQAAFTAPGALQVQTAADQPPRLLEAEAVIIATGSVPRFPPGLRPDGKRVLAPRFMSSLDSLPPDIIVVGGGVTGSEFVSLFSRLGVRVTWLVGPAGVLPQFYPDAGQALVLALALRGVTVRIGAPATQLEIHEAGVTVNCADGSSATAAMAFLALGRTPDLQRLNLSMLDLQPQADGTLVVDSYGRTIIPGVYAVGDAAGGPMLANRAMAQGWIAGQHAAGLTVAPYRPETIIHAVYTDPELAQVGVLDDPAEALLRVRAPQSDALKAHLFGETEGWIELSYNAKDRRVRGGVAVGPHAADLLAPVALAISLGATIDQLGTVFAANPAISELVFLTARGG
ncbi:MAG: dihydrolipoyl dehydrogenase family protein [Oscillochloridaceae bacterium umkhey_bin13]